LALSNCESAIGQEINIASNYEISMRDLLFLIAKLMKSDVKIIEENERFRPKNSEVFRLWGDNKKINQLVGFKPQYNIEQGLAETISWFGNSENLKKYKSTIYNL